MPANFDAVFGPEPLPGAPSVLRRSRRRDTAFSIDTDRDLGIVLSLSESQRAVRRMAGRTESDLPRVGTATLMPPGLPAAFALSGPARVLMLRIAWRDLAAWIAEDHGIDPDRLELQPRLHADDPVLARAIYRAAANGAGADEAGRDIAARLATHHAVRPVARPGHAVRGGLSPPKLRRVLELIETHVSDSLPIERLAAEAGASPFHFAREFRRVMGVAPHRHVTRRRVERAIALMADRTMSLQSIATHVGFAHASHLARHMRGLTGASPARFRADVLP